MQINTQKKCHIQDCPFVYTNSTGHRIHMTMSQRQIPSRHTLTHCLWGNIVLLAEHAFPLHY